MNTNETLLDQNTTPKKISLLPLTENYRPDILLFRNQQIREVESVFSSPSNQKYENHGEDERCLLLQGFSGSGKTTVVSFVLKKYKTAYLLASGANNPTAFLLIKSLFDINASTTGAAIQKAIDKLKKKKKVLVVDEINKLKNTEEIGLFFDMLNTIYRAVKCPMILVTNKKGFLDFIPVDGRRTFHPERIDFKSYDIQELYEILNSRVGIIKKESEEFSIEPEFIAMVAKFVFNKFDGSVRSAFSLLRKCIVGDDFSEKFLQKTCDNLITEEKSEDLRMLTEYNRKFLKSVYDMSTNEGLNVSFKKLEGVKFPDIVLSTGYSKGRVSQLLQYFEEYHGVLQSTKENKGRAGGRSRLVKFSSDKDYEIVKEVLYGKNHNEI
ncbi:MAG TPA: AAA family ATPase [bacterium]|nr:AAA family ATPase [bacterium]